MKAWGILVCILLCKTSLHAAVVNVYVWGGEIPKASIHQFEKETGIKVNFSTYDSNETLYAKLKASNKAIYDVILPSAYFVERMKKQNMLMPLMHDKLPNLIHLDSSFKNHDYDPNNQYSIPLTWGVTGIFYNKHHIQKPPTNWASLWDKRFRNQLMILDDARELFGIALMKLHYSPNDTNPEHIKAAYEALLNLLPNVKLFANEGIQSNMIDEDALLGVAWNGDALKAHLENPQIQFKFPTEGVVLWIDCLAIPKNPPHLREAYEFINFMLKPQSAEQIALHEGHAITNKTAIQHLPEAIKNNPLIYPLKETLNHAFVQRDVGQDTMKRYNQYWQTLKLSI